MTFDLHSASKFPTLGRDFLSAFAEAPMIQLPSPSLGWLQTRTLSKGGRFLSATPTHLRVFSRRVVPTMPSTDNANHQPPPLLGPGRSACVNIISSAITVVDDALHPQIYSSTLYNSPSKSGYLPSNRPLSVCVPVRVQRSVGGEADKHIDMFFPSRWMVSAFTFVVYQHALAPIVDVRIRGDGMYYDAGPGM